jgi:hypothetical protein
MASLALWMADQVCPLLAYFGVHACTTTNNLHLVGGAGWIFSGIALLMLMGIADHIANRRAARRAGASGAPFALKLARRAPPQIYETQRNREPLVAQRRPFYRLRHVRRRNPNREMAQVPTQIHSQCGKPSSGAPQRQFRWVNIPPRGS